MAEQVARGLGGLVLVEIGRARKQLMPIGQDPSRHQSRIPQRTESEHQINAFHHMIDVSVGDEDVHPDIRMGGLKCVDQRHEERVGDARRRGKP